MGLFISKKEQLLWITTCIVVLGIYSTLGLAGDLADYFVEQNLFTLLYLIGFLLTGLVITAFGFTKKSRPIEWLIYIVVFISLIMVFTRSGISMVERTHLFEYGLVSVLIFNALLERKSSMLASTLLAFLITTILGSIDEILQYFLPNRVFDWLDILRNTIAGFVGISLNSLIILLRKRVDQRS